MNYQQLLVALLTGVISAGAVISFIISMFIPLVTALVSKQSWPRDVKGIITLTLSAVSSFLTLLLQSINDHTHFDWRTVVITALLNLGIAIGSYLGWWKQGLLQPKLHAFPRKGWMHAKPIRSQRQLAVNHEILAQSQQRASMKRG